MRRRLSYLLAAPILLAIAACASEPSFVEVYSSLAPPEEGEARIFFYRNRNPMRWDLRPDIHLNGEVVGQSVPGSAFYVDRPAGDYEVRCGPPGSDLSFTLEAGEIRYVRSNFQMSQRTDRVHLYLVPEDEALPYLLSLDYTEPVLPEDPDYTKPRSDAIRADF